MQKITVTAFLKIGQETHIDRLYRDGLIYCNSVRYFRELETKNKQRHDNREASDSSIKAVNLQLFLPGSKKPLPITFTMAHLNTFNEAMLDTHLFCLYTIKPEHATGKPFIARENLGFGNKALIVTNPTEFVNRIKAKLNDIVIFYGPVEYYDEDIDHQNLTVFHKPDRFNYQNEFRFHLTGHNGPVLSFEIGSIQDISVVLDANNLDQLRLQYASELLDRRKM